MNYNNGPANALCKKKIGFKTSVVEANETHESVNNLYIIIIIGHSNNHIKHVYY